ncbi:MAG: hypothetical protein WCC10_06185 [Tumebacillaceae bacterium]
MKTSILSFLLTSAVCLSAPTAVVVAAPAQETVVQPVKLTFSPVEITREVRKANVPASALPLTPQKAMRYLIGADELLTTKPTPNGTILLYSKQGDRENFYAAFLSKDVLYDLGEIGTRTSLEKTGVAMEKFQQTPLLRISGIYGANVVETTYFYLMGTEPRPLLVAEGHLFEQDLDRDGFPEIIASSGTPQITTIYKYKDGRFQQADLNRQLNAVSVQPHQADHSLFDVYFKGQTNPVTFRYSAGTLQPVSR